MTPKGSKLTLMLTTLSTFLHLRCSIKNCIYVQQEQTPHQDLEWEGLINHRYQEVLKPCVLMLSIKKDKNFKKKSCELYIRMNTLKMIHELSTYKSCENIT